ncbi:MAG: response regulator [Geobacteraceae bacterium]|nr:response regulator [Geobacteraceae bacterium]
MKSILSADKKTILIVEDEDQLSFFFRKLMEGEGYNVITASNGQEAVDSYKTNPDRIDMVLMDIKMPVMSGIEAHKELKQIDPCVPVLLMSAYTQESLEGIATSYFIRKPMRPSELLNAISEVLNESASCYQNLE